MQIFLCIITAIVSLFIVSPAIIAFLRTFTFAIPFSKKMNQYKVYNEAVHKQLIFVELFANIIFLLLAIAIIIGIIVFMQTSQLIIMLLSIVFCFFICYHKLQINQDNIRKFTKRHYVCMDMQQFDQYIAEFIDTKR